VWLFILLVENGIGDESCFDGWADSVDANDRCTVKNGDDKGSETCVLACCDGGNVAFMERLEQMSEE
jgi:hypothetical protein